MFLQQHSNRVIGVVIPGYGHPQFLNEALQDLKAQTMAPRLRVVVVDDGCPYAETAAVTRHAMAGATATTARETAETSGGTTGKTAQESGETSGEITETSGRATVNPAGASLTLYYIRQPNRKLPAARNAGIRFLLTLHPELEAIYFLDADNRLSAHGLQHYEEALFSQPHLGWAYPDIAFFGLTPNPLGVEVRETAPDYQLLKQMMGNISEAGSLVRADIFRAGLFFDEDLRDGFEDWDFWLSCVEAGWRGIRAPHSGFLYRRRPNSMLVESRRREEVLVGQLRAKHPVLFSLKTLLRLLHEEAPVFALIDARQKQVVLTADPLVKGRVLDFEAFKLYCLARRDHPQALFAPMMVIAAWHLFWLDGHKITPHFRYCLWTLLDTIDQSGPRAVRIKDGGRHVCQLRQARSGLGLRHLLAASFRDFIRLMEQGEEQWQQIHMLCPGLVWPKDTGIDRADEESRLTGPWIQRLLSRLRLAPRHRSRLQNPDRRYAGPDARKLSDVLIEDISGIKAALYPWVPDERRSVLVVIDWDRLCAPGMIDLVLDLLKRLTAAGGRVRLGLEIEGDRDFSPDLERLFVADVADCVPIIRQKHLPEHQTYLGRRLPQPFSLEERQGAVRLAQGADAVLCLGLCALQAVMGDLKTFGVTGLVYADRPFYDPTIRPPLSGDGMVTCLLAYEHATTAIICGDAPLRTALVAEGVPPGKLLAPARLVDMIRGLKQGQAGVRLLSSATGVKTRGP